MRSYANTASGGIGSSGSLVSREYVLIFAAGNTQLPLVFA
jgi:hypothetical protein